MELRIDFLADGDRTFLVFDLVGESFLFSAEWGLSVFSSPALEVTLAESSTERVKLPDVPEMDSLR